MKTLSNYEKEFIAACSSEQNAYLALERALDEWLKWRAARQSLGARPQPNAHEAIGLALDLLGKEFFK